MADTVLRSTPREWLREGPFPWPPVDQLPENTRVSACFCVASKQLLRTKADKPYLRLHLCDRSGAIEGRIWDGAERIDAEVAAGAFIGVRGRVELYNGQRQFKVEEVAVLEVDNGDLDLFLPRSGRPFAVMEAELDVLIASILDEPLRLVVGRLLGEDSETGKTFRRAPAAKRNHHAYVGGLLEHSLSVAQGCDRMARHYGHAIDRDLLVAGALLHDIGKIREIGFSGGFPYTDQGKLLGHILLGLEMVRDAARSVPELAEERLLLLLHLVASHQGRHEWQSPKIPMILEALILHYVDDLDAKMHQAQAMVAAVELGWTPYDGSFGREFFRHRLDPAEGDARADAGEPPPPPVGGEDGERTGAPEPETGLPARVPDLESSRSTLDLFG